MIADACGLGTVTASGLSSPLVYQYSGSATFTADYTASSSSCPLVYTCESEDPSIDWCALNDGTTVSTFDGATGEWTLTTSDKVNYPPGTYSVIITGYIDPYTVVNASERFQFTLEDPCGSAVLSGSDASLTYQYIGTGAFTSPFSVDLPGCAIVYECDGSAGANDMCALNDGSSTTTFDVQTGVLDITSTDKVTYPSGSIYTVQVTATIDGHP